VAGGVLEGACPGHNTVYHSRSFVRVDFVRCLVFAIFCPIRHSPITSRLRQKAMQGERSASPVCHAGSGTDNGPLAPRFTQNGDESARLPDWSRSFPSLADRRADLPAA